MPLDMTGFGGVGPSFKALLIVPKIIGGHLGHQCPSGIWASAAASLFAQKNEIDMSDVFMTTAVEVTTGHLQNHEGKTCILGLGSPQQQAPELSKPITGTPALNFDFISGEFPMTTDQILSQGRPFDVVLLENVFRLALYDVDSKASKRTDTIMLRDCTYVADLRQALTFRL